MSTASLGFHPFQERLKTATRSMMWLGIGMIVLGVVALVFPLVSTLAITLFVGSLFLIYGAMSLGLSFSVKGAGPFFGALLFSLASIGAGIFTLFHPLAGAVVLTLMVGVLFMMQGASEAVFAFELRPAPGWVAMLTSAIASILLAVVIFVRWPAISLVVLGVLFGVNFISSGIGLIMVSRAVKSDVA